MKSFFSVISLTFISLTFCMTARAENLFISDTQRVALLELYTSEGCSSCPPADNWLSQLVSHPALWQQIVPLAFHVDYWNYIGWHDRFSSPVYSARQRRYAADDNLSTVYTPGFLINGIEWRGFFQLEPLPLDTMPGPGTLKVRVKDKTFAASFSPVNDTAVHELYLNIAILGFDLETRVKAGENRDRRLRHNFVVLGYRSVVFNRNATDYRIEAMLPDIVESAPRLAIAAWINLADNPTPLQAVGGWLK